MKLFKKVFAVGLVLFGLTGTVFAQGTPGYFTAGPSVAGTSSSIGYIPAVPGLTPRIVYMSADSDLATSVFSLKKGVGLYSVGTNTGAGTLINVTTTNGLATSDTLVIQTASGSITNFTISSFAANGTNVTLSGTAAFGYTNGDTVFKMSAATTFPIGATTNKVHTGEAVWVGNYGRPIMFTINGTSWAILNTVSYRQE